MPTDALARPIGIGMPVIYGFILVLTRLAGMFTFLPLPGARQLLEPAKIVMAAVLTIALFPFWPVRIESPGPGLFVAWMAREAALGLVIGLVISFLAESVTMAAQLVATQAGYSYASSIDPNSDADSGVLPVMAQLFASLLFFSLGLHRRLIAGVVATLETLPPGGDWKLAVAPEDIAGLATTMFQTGLSLALPVIAILLILDLTLALLARINQQLQLLSIAFPAKMLVGLGVFAICTPAIAMVYESQAARVFELLGRILAGMR